MNIVVLSIEFFFFKSQSFMERWNSTMWYSSSVCGFQSQGTCRAPKRKSMDHCSGSRWTTHTHTHRHKDRRKLKWIYSWWACDPNSIQMFQSILGGDQGNHRNCPLTAASALCQRGYLGSWLCHLLHIAELGRLGLPLFHGCCSFFPLFLAPFFMP